MKTLLIAVLALLMACSATACSSGERPFDPEVFGGSGSGDRGGSSDSGDENTDNMKVMIRIGSTVFTATLRDTPAAAAFGRLLPVTAEMRDHNRNEKYYDLTSELPVSTYYPETIHSGDIMLFGSRTLVLFYKTFRTSYGYTRIGVFDDPSGLEAALGEGDATVVFERIPMHDDLPLRR